MIDERLRQAVEYIGSCSSLRPVTGIVLGSGLGDFANSLDEAVAIPYSDIPHFKRVSVPGHAGRLVLGKAAGAPVAVLQGRYHYYEGHDIADVVFPVRVLARLGVRQVLLTNAAGGIGSHLAAGDLMLIRDHLNLMGVNPLHGENDERLGPRFPDMSLVYDAELREIVADDMKRMKIAVKSGVYAALSGPSYETPAEIQMLARLGADAVGMSTVPEAIAARHMGARVVAISCISNLAAGISKRPLSHEEVTATADRVKGLFSALLSAAIPRFPTTFDK